MSQQEIMREWEAFIPEAERNIYEKAGYKGKEKFGVNPALLIIDVITGFTGTKPMPVMEAIDEFPTSCGQVAWDALPKIKELLGACRNADVPVIYSTSDPDFKAAFGNATKRSVDATDFEKLAVETRSAATLRALEASAPPPLYCQKTQPRSYE